MTTTTSILFGSKLRTVVTIALSLVVVIAGAFVVGLVGVPTVERVDGEFGAVNDSHTEVRATLTVDNPNPIGTRAVDVTADYVVRANGVELARGHDDAVSVAPGTSTETVTAWMDNAVIPRWWASHVRNGERTTVVVDAQVTTGILGYSRNVTRSRTVETDLLSSFESTEPRPIDADVPFAPNPVLYLNETRASWGNVDANRTELELAADAYNPGEYDVPVTQIGYAITMNGVVVGEGETAGGTVLESGEETTVTATTAIEHDRLDEWWVAHLENGQQSELRIEFEARIELPTGSTVTVPLEALTYEETVETDLLGEGDSRERSRYCFVAGTCTIAHDAE
ncbi:LEA type 2 family protein [Natribaculum luteum]|uniref:LEA type 2 family protein n=1 Tax=Natribaculum luteum TaxID=1586232 RepID=A0ABD5P3X4_9EURY|nr:LEA type 2 family protein [Natribaculum luteum]